MLNTEFDPQDFHVAMGCHLLLKPPRSNTLCFSQEPRKGGFSKGGFCRVQCHDQGNKYYQGYWPQQYIWHSERHSQERRTFCKNPLLKTPSSWFLIQARKRHININCLVRLLLGRPRECPGDKLSLSLGQSGFVPGTNPGFLLILHKGSPVCPRDKPSLSLGQSWGRRAA